MNTLEIAMAWTLMHSLWQGSIGALLVAVLFRATRSSDVRYRLACIALFAVFASFVATFVYYASSSSEISGSRQESRLPDPREFVLDAGAAGNSMTSRLEAALPWITPVWLVGAAIFN